MQIESYEILHPHRFDNQNFTQTATTASYLIKAFKLYKIQKDFNGY